MPFSWPRPDGIPLTNEAWASPARMLGSFDVHWVTAGGWWPKVDTTYRAPAAWLPQASIAFKDLVDHMARQVLGRASTAQLLQACCEHTGCTPGEIINANHALVRWRWAWLLTTLLDSPSHFTR